ncbi:hypothetical protein Tco_0033580 [Tanacetum coccineum]
MVAVSRCVRARVLTLLQQRAIALFYHSTEEIYVLKSNPRLHLLLDDQLNQSIPEKPEHLPTYNFMNLDIPHDPHLHKLSRGIANDVIQRMIFGPSSEMIWRVINLVGFRRINILDDDLPNLESPPRPVYKDEANLMYDTEALVDGCIVEAIVCRQRINPGEQLELLISVAERIPDMSFTRGYDESSVLNSMCQEPSDCMHLIKCDVNWFPIIDEFSYWRLKSQSC